MTKVQQLVRRNTVLAVLALGLALFVTLRPSETSAVSTDDLPALFPDLTIDDVREIVLSKPGLVEPGAGAESLRLVRRREQGWDIASRNDYPAETSKVSAFLEDLVGAREKRVITERADAFGGYAGPEGWTDVAVKDGAGKSLAALSIGKMARWPDAYVKISVGGKERIVLAHNLRTDRARLEVAEWGESRLWPGLSVDDVERIDVFQRAEKQTLSFGRKAPPAELGKTDGEEEAGDGANEGDETPPVPDAPDTPDAPDAPDTPDAPAAPEWVMRAPKPAEVESYRVENLVRSFTGMRLEDVAPLSLDPQGQDGFGLAKPSYRVVLHLEPASEGEEGRRHILLIGDEKLDAEGQGTERWYVKRENDPWVFLVRTSAIADFRLPADDFLPPKEEPAEEKPAEGSPDGD